MLPSREQNVPCLAARHARYTFPREGEVHLEMRGIRGRFPPDVPPMGPPRTQAYWVAPAHLNPRRGPCNFTLAINVVLPASGATLIDLHPLGSPGCAVL